jgi:hypothetical protein
MFKLARAENPDFPTDFDERLDSMSTQRGRIQRKWPGLPKELPK